MAKRNPLQSAATSTGNIVSDRTLTRSDGPPLEGLTVRGEIDTFIREPRLTLKVGISRINAASLIVSGERFPRKADVSLECFYRSRDNVFTSTPIVVTVKVDPLGNFVKSILLRPVAHSYKYQLFVTASRNGVMLQEAHLPLSAVFGG